MRRGRAETPPHLNRAVVWPPDNTSHAEIDRRPNVWPKSLCPAPSFSASPSLSIHGTRLPFLPLPPHASAPFRPFPLRPPNFLPSFPAPRSRRPFPAPKMLFHSLPAPQKCSFASSPKNGRSQARRPPKCSFTGSPHPKMLFHRLAAPKNALSQPPRPQKCSFTAPRPNTWKTRFRDPKTPRAETV